MSIILNKKKKLYKMILNHGCNLGLTFLPNFYGVFLNTDHGLFLFFCFVSHILVLLIKIECMHFMNGNIFLSIFPFSQTSGLFGKYAIHGILLYKRA